MSTRRSIPLGPFDLLRPVERGGMSAVWRAVHRARHTSVAIKAVTAPIGREHDFRAWFAGEVRAVARLDHPTIVRVHDHGEISAEVADATGGRLPEGAPYMVMEWLGGGPLRRRRALMDWPQVRRILLALLDALAHAHARGVVHRDLKTDNILLADRGPVLSDFGLAFTLRPDGTAQAPVAAGTPEYMAPEQVDNDWRAFGPWTDLYALGCVAYELVSGYPPFSRPSDDRAQDAMSLMVAHLRAPVPPLRAKMPVPEGLGDFVRRLLAKEPAGRYRFAADAMRALETLPAEAPEALRREPQTTIPVGPMAVISTAEPGTLGSAEAASSPLPSDLLLTSARPIDALAATGLANESALLTAIIDPSAMAPAGFDVGRHSPLDVPLIMPTDWRELQPNAAPPPLQGVGRSLFGQREPRSCGRGVERDALWATLRAVVAGQGARAIVLEAPSGYGKRHLSQWIAYRAHEMGAAVLLRTDHERPHGPACGLGPMFARALRVGELSSARRVQRIAAALGLPAHDERVLALSSAIDAESPTLSDVREVLAASDQRFDAYAAALGRVAGDRAAVIRLDNVQYGEDATRFAGYVLAHRSELPALLLLTVRTDALRPGSPEQVALAELLQSPSAACLPLGPLPPGPYAELLQSLLPLRVDLVESIIQRTAGCPLFGLELLQHWIRTEALEDSPEGFRLRSGAERIAPEGLQAVWRARIDEALAGEGQGAQCFELAAVLGLVVDNAEWTAVCAHAGLHADPAVTERMLDARLIRRVDGGRWTFTHAMVREALQQRVRRAGRWAWANRLCADMLLMRGENEPIRLAEHLMAAGDHAAAIGPLVAADDMRHEATDLPRVRRLLSQRLRALRALRCRLDDPRWTAVRIRWAHLCGTQSRPDRARRWAARAASVARQAGDAALLAAALIQQGRAATERVEEALPLLAQAAAAARQAGDPQLEAYALQTVGDCQSLRGRLNAAEEVLQQALRLLGARGDGWLRARILLRLAGVAHKRGDDERARTLSAEAAELFRRAGTRAGVAEAYSVMGDLARRAGDFAEAERQYRESRRLFSALSAGGVHAAECSLAMVLIESGRFGEARDVLERALAATLSGGHAVRQFLFAAMLACAADAWDWATWDRCMAEIGPLLQGRLTDLDVAIAARRAAELAEIAGQGQRADDAWRLAYEQYEAMGRRTEADQLNREIESVRRRRQVNPGILTRFDP